MYASWLRLLLLLLVCVSAQRKPPPPGVQRRPPPPGSQRKPPPPGAQRKPPPPGAQRKPLPPAPQRKPLPSAAQRKPLLSTTPGKPLPPAGKRKPLLSTTPEKPLPSTTQRKPLLSTTPGKPLPSNDEGNQPLPLKGHLKPNKNTGKMDYDMEVYLDAAIMLIRAAKKAAAASEKSDNNPLYDRIGLDESDSKSPNPNDRVGADEPENTQSSPRCPAKPMDCEELIVKCGISKSGIYRVYPRSRLDLWNGGGFSVHCDMETEGGGWTVIQRRDDFGASPDFFFKDWKSYKEGFGDLNKDYWMGNDKIFAISNQRRSVLRFDLLDFEGKSGFATYDNFYIEDESGAYRLHLGDFRGNIGDSFTAHNRCKFTTKDRDNDNYPSGNCALLYKGGWWYNNCHTVNLNGQYLKGKHSSYANGVNWYDFKGFYYSLKQTEMKVRSVNFTRKDLP